MPPSNTAAWLKTKNAGTLSIGPAPYTSPHVDEIVVKNAAIAVNPVDWIVPVKGDIMYGWLKYPCILGIDVAGEVVEVGKQVTRFKIGDRVLGFARGTDEKSNNSAETAFQEFTVLQSDLATPIPSTMSYESASVLPLGLGTAAAALFQKDYLGLQRPSLSPKPTGQTLIVWGGSTSVGCNAIQLGVAAGYEVFTTASPKNFDLVTKLGASQVFDYNSPTVVFDMTKALKGKVLAGAVSIGLGSADACMDILDKSTGRKFIAMATFPISHTEEVSFAQTIFRFLSWTIVFKVKGLVKGIKSNFLNGSSVCFNEVGKMCFEEFLPKALETGSYVAAPEPHVVGNGIESIQTALDYQKKGVSAQKVVITL